MAVPSITTTQSVLSYGQYQEWEFQPYATNSPTSWTTTALPPGMALNTSTGKISGAALLPGVYLVGFRAINGDGTSDAQIITIGIDAVSDAAPSGLVQVNIDTMTKQVTFGPLGAPIAPAENGALFTLKSGDDPVFHVVFHRGGVVVELDLADLSFGVKENEGDGLVIESTDWATSGTAYRVYGQFTGDALEGALGNSDPRRILALGEFKWTENNGYDPAIGPETLVNRSQTFLFELPRMIVE
jgi:hypothetical protein